ncbi:hypothetical protein BSK66_27895, partial [Paenibacillus odorifer]|uniref:hypothetical protein n=2 Tax=Paenibacillus TaxID=44249 RepID=UPI00097A37A8
AATILPIYGIYTVHFARAATIQLICGIYTVHFARAATIQLICGIYTTVVSHSHTNPQIFTGSISNTFPVQQKAWDGIL